jgi:glycine cleavage system transcriptional repressor
MQCAISIFGKDRPGIIAEITSVLVSHQVNIEDASMTILQGHFAMILVVSMDESSYLQVQEDLKASETLQGFSINFSKQEFQDQLPERDDQTFSRYLLQLTVDDMPGIVAKVSKVLGSFGANIVDCSTRKNNETHVFTMLLDVDVPTDKENEIVSQIESASNSFVGDVVFRKLDSVEM